MENWGIITYKENSLLWNETIHPSSRQLNIVRLISHEFSHQNFGNRVSNQWWSYVWLKEGFATLFEVIGTDLVSGVCYFFMKHFKKKILGNFNSSKSNSFLFECYFYSALPGMEHVSIFCNNNTS